MMATLTIGVEGKCYFHVDEFEVGFKRWNWVFSYMVDGCPVLQSGSQSSADVFCGYGGETLLVQTLERALERWARDVCWEYETGEEFDPSPLIEQLEAWLDGRR